MEAGRCRREGVVVLVVSPQECGGGWPLQEGGCCSAGCEPGGGWPLQEGGCCSAGCEPPGMWWRLAAACRREGVVVLVVSPQECGGGWPLHVGGRVL